MVDGSDRKGLVDVSKSTQLVLGVATLWPLVYMFLFLAYIVWMVFGVALEAGPHGGSREPTTTDVTFVRSFFGIFAVHILTMLEILGLTVFYVIDVFRTTRLPSDQRVLWLLVIFFAGPIGMPIYWYLNIWREPSVLAQRPIEQR
jgi:hypothetical protein